MSALNLIYLLSMNDATCSGRSEVMSFKTKRGNTVNCPVTSILKTQINSKIIKQKGNGKNVCKEGGNRKLFIYSN